MTDTQQEQATQIEEAFSLFDDWEDRYQILIDLGRKLPPMPAEEKTEDNRVRGCQSNVWMAAHVENEGDSRVIRFDADSDAAITKGLVAILWHLYSGQPVERILAFDIDGYLERLGLNQHLSMTRRNGLYSMVQRVKALATMESVR